MTTPASSGERLQKYLAHAGVASRRHAEELIQAGAVTVNGQVVRELGTRVDPATDEVRVRGAVVRPAEDALYILLNKPTDTVTTASDPQGRRTVLDLLPDEWRAQRVYPVGRLDRDTEGLLLLTNDGDFALRLTHPRYAPAKEYAALVVGRPSPGTLDRLSHGILLPGETRPTAPARAWLMRSQGDATWVGIELHEGRNRQVRRMLEAVGHPAVRLRRVRIGPLTLGPLAPGKARLLTAHEVEQLHRATTPSNRHETLAVKPASPARPAEPRGGSGPRH
ncbi:MAG TPA: pseudouridine synthase [Ktedonobacterales bacterium]|nr:pseudouridine synthase [Ktedonobacterales bacterium]